MRNRLPEQSTSSVPERAASNRSSRDDDASAIAFMRDRLKSLDQELKTSKGFVDVWRNKAKRALEGEEFLLNEIKELNEQLLSE